MTASFWSRAEAERRTLQAEFATKATDQMLTAGAIDPASLSPQARRTLAWLAEIDDPTVEGVADLLAAAHRSGLQQRHGQVADRLDALSRRVDDRAVEL